MKTPSTGEKEYKLNSQQARKDEMPPQDTFRKEYKPLTDLQKGEMKLIKEKAEELEAMISGATTPTNGREMAVAKTNLEQAIMWAVKGVTN